MNNRRRGRRRYIRWIAPSRRDNPHVKSRWAVGRIDQNEQQAYCFGMTAIAEKLDRKLSDWKPETASEVEKLVAEIIDWADADALDLMRPRYLEQEVLDIIDAD